MPAQLLDGNALARAMRGGFRARVSTLENNGIRPGLAVVLVGDDPASLTYVGNKIRACEESGVESTRHLLPGTTETSALLALIAQLNGDASVHGILVQLPLPRHVDPRPVLEAIAAAKDVDGFHPYNVGALVVGRSDFPPCTPHGVQHLLEQTGVALAGTHVVVGGASIIVGKPMALMMLQQEATVTVCHARTVDLARHTRQADILVVAVGRPGLITADMVKPGAIVIDVGINRLPDGKLVGDVDFERVRARASWITPVPGGVGPMTVTMLIENTLRAAEHAATGARAPA